MGADQDGGVESILNVLLAEFGAVREEILATINMQYTILSLGTGFLAGLFGIALSQSSNPASVYLLLLVPFVSVAVSALWAVEGIRRLRASSYVRDELSPKVDVILRDRMSPIEFSERKLLGYEFFLREDTSTDLKKWNNMYYRLSQVGVIGIFMGSGIAAVALVTSLMVIPPPGTSLGTVGLFGLIVVCVELVALGSVGYVVSSVIEASRNLIPKPTGTDSVASEPRSDMVKP